jgi:hypothetical protein
MIYKQTLELGPLILFAFGRLYGLPNMANVAATQSPAGVFHYCGVTAFMAIAAFLVMIQLASMPKQAQEFSKRVTPGVDSVEIPRQRH